MESQESILRKANGIQKVNHLLFEYFLPSDFFWAISKIHELLRVWNTNSLASRKRRSVNAGSFTHPFYGIQKLSKLSLSLCSLLIFPYQNGRIILIYWFLTSLNVPKQPIYLFPSIVIFENKLGEKAVLSTNWWVFQSPSFLSFACSFTLFSCFFEAQFIMLLLSWSLSFLDSPITFQSLLLPFFQTERITLQHVIPDLISTITPTVDLQVFFGEGAGIGDHSTENCTGEVLAGVKVEPFKTFFQDGSPKIVATPFHPEEKRYTLMMIDLDVPNEAEEGFGTFCHWLM